MGNRIPRNAKKLEVVFLLKSSAGECGTKTIIEKTDRGWSGEIGGTYYHFLVDLLRNENYCSIKVIE